MNHKTLIATYYWPPSGGAGVQRFLKFCKYLPQFGINPTVLTVSNPTYPIADKSLKEEIPDEIEVIRSKTLEPFHVYAGLTGKDTSDVSNPTQELKSDSWMSWLATWIRANIFIPDARVGWLFTGRKKALNTVQNKQIDSIVTTGPPHSTHFIGKYVKERAGIRWIADLRDPWSEIYYNQLMPRTNLAKKIDRKLEKTVLKSADEVVVVSPSMKNIMREIHQRSYHMIPNGFDPEDFDHNEEDISSYRYTSFTIRFVGSVKEAAIPTGMFKALSDLPDETDVCLEFIGNIHPKVRNQIEAYGITSNVYIRSYIPHKEAVKAMQAADLLLLSISKTENSEQILTGKLFDYLGAQTPILFMGTTKGDAAKIIRETGQGTCFEHEDVEQIRAYLEKVIQNPETLPEIERKKNMKDHVYSRINLTSQLAQLLT